MRLPPSLLYSQTLLKYILSAPAPSLSTTHGYRHTRPPPGQGRARCSANLPEGKRGRETGVGGGWVRGEDAELRRCRISHLAASGLARPWVDGRAGGRLMASADA